MYNMQFVNFWVYSSVSHYLEEIDSMFIEKAYLVCYEKSVWNFWAGMLLIEFFW